MDPIVAIRTCAQCGSVWSKQQFVDTHGLHAEDAWKQLVTHNAVMAFCANCPQTHVQKMMPK